MSVRRLRKATRPQPSLIILWPATQLSVVTWKWMVYSSVSQPPGRGPVPASGINYSGPREVRLEFVILVS